uniref:Inosine triphosphate pyrophosphatase n=1 Tax=Trichuris muris TaxID=70415 RepID=A0A5S6QFV2_TRIMR
MKQEVAVYLCLLMEKRCEVTSRVPVIYYVTSSRNKIAEMADFLAKHAEIVVKCVDLPEYQGEPDDVAKQKCLTAAQIFQPVIVEDTCLCFNALAGLPGPYVKWFLKAIGPEGLYKLLDGWEDKSAYALCTYAYKDASSSEVRLIQGKVAGTIVQPRGESNFGWDACFQPDGLDRTFAELSSEEKRAVSHRACALQKLSHFLQHLHKPAV